MPSYNFTVLGLNVSFKADADRERIEEAKDLVEQKYKDLDFDGRRLSKEKLLTYLALGLADDVLQSTQKLDAYDDKLKRLLAKIDKG